MNLYQRLKRLEGALPAFDFRRRIVVLGPDDPVPPGADEVIRIVPAEFPRP